MKHQIEVTSEEKLLLVYLLDNVVGHHKHGSCNIESFCAEKAIDRQDLSRRLRVPVSPARGDG